MDFAEIVPIGQTAVILGGGVWAIANIKAMTFNAAERINDLKEVLEDLKEWIVKVESRTNEHSERISRLEANNDSAMRRHRQ